MATLNAYDIGDLVRVTGNLTTLAGAAADPDALICKVKSPAGVTTTYTYGTTAFPVRAEAGEYYVDVTPDTPGEWVYQFRSTGTGQAMDEGTFIVRESRI